MTAVIVLRQDGTSVRHQLDAESVIGRDEENLITVPDSFLSRQHCRLLMKEDNRVVLEDMGSSNGTFVNASRIEEAVEVGAGDVIRIGRTRLFLEFGDEPGEGELGVLYPRDERATVGKEQRASKLEVNPLYQTDPALQVAQAPPVAPAAPTPLSPEASAAAQKAPGDTTLSQQQRVAPTDPLATASDTSQPAVPRHAPETRSLDRGSGPPPPPTVGESALSRMVSGHKFDSAKTSQTNLRVITEMAAFLNILFELDELMDYALGKALEAIPAERGVLLLFDAKLRRLYPGAFRAAFPERSEEIRLKGISHSITRRAITERVSILVENAKDDSRFSSASSVAAYNLRSVLAVPLWRDSVVRGLIYLDNRTSANAFGSGHVDLATALANLIATGMSQLELRVRASLADNAPPAG